MAKDEVVQEVGRALLAELTEIRMTLVHISNLLQAINESRK